MRRMVHMKLPALLIGTAMLLSFFIISVNPIHDAMDSVFTDTDTGWEEETRITDERADSYDPVVLDDGNGNAHIVWTDERSGTPQLFYAKYDGAGNVVVPETRLTNTIAPSGVADM